MDDIQKKVLSIIREIAPLARKTADAEFLTSNFLDDGTVDSLQIVEMITTFESRFGIKFLPSHLESEKFRTPAGICDVVKERLGDFHA